MRRLTLLILFLLPALLWAQTETKIGSLLTVKAAETAKTETPLHMVKRVSKLTDRATVYQDSAHFARKEYDKGHFMAELASAPVRWNDNETLRDYDLSIKEAVTKGYQKLVRLGPSTVELDSLGNMRYEKGGSWFEVRPLFKGIKATFEPQPTKMKATYFIDNDMALTWKLTDPHRMAARKIPAFTALDAARKPIELVETRTDTSLSVRVKDAKGVTWPVAIDPTIQDTAVAASGTAPSFKDSWINSRNSEYSRPSHTSAWSDNSGSVVGRGGTQEWRWLFVFNLAGTMPEGSVVDSAYFNVNFGATTTSDSCVFYAVKGNWGAKSAVDTTRFNNFDGWQASGSYADGVFNYVTPLKFTGASGTGWYAMQLTAAATDTLEMHSADTLRFMCVTHETIYGSAGGGSNNIIAQGSGASFPVLSVYYHTGGPPGVSTLADMDTLKVNGSVITATMVGKVDSTGGTIDSVGVRYMKKGLSLSTNGLVKKKAQGDLSDADTFYVALASTDSLTKDTLYVYQLAAHSAGGWSYSGTYDTLSTYIGPAFPRTTADPIISAWPWMHATMSMTVDSCGRNLGDYAAAARIGSDSLISYGFFYWLKGTSVVDSVKHTWNSGPKWCDEDDLSLSTSTADTLLSDTVYFFTAFVKGSLGPRSFASDTQAIAIDGVFVVGLSAPTYDLASVSVQFNARVDSTGTVPARATTRGFFAWLREPNPVVEHSGTDTVTVSETNVSGYPYSLYSLAMALTTDTVYLWRSYAINSVGTAYGDIDSVRTYLEGLTASLVVGGTDTVSVIIYTGGGATTGIFGRGPRRFEGR